MPRAHAMRLVSCLALAASGLVILAAAPASQVLRAAGSTTVAPLLTRWSAALAKGTPPVTITVDAKGSATAPPALLAGSAEIGAMSRPMSDEEIASFQHARGYAPTPVRVALDAVAILVHPSNPLQRISYAELRRIYGGEAKTWGDLGAIDPQWRARPILRLTRDVESGTHELFVKQALGGQTIAPGARAVESLSAMDAAIATDPGAIGYGSVGEGAQRVRALELAADAKGGYFAPTVDNVNSLRYPMSRFLYLYLDAAPGKPLAPAITTLLRTVCSADGQAAVRAEGYLPLPLDFCRKDLMRIMAR
jgi:phosphate transport system substrate-binding protein